MDPTAFVVMPFDTKAVEHDIVLPGREGRSRRLNFNAIFYSLLKPALEGAGYAVLRGDSYASAGDIRSDMFYDLVTADLVVADVTILNANVYYELGIRHGVSPRGAFLVKADLETRTPFDIAPDRYFVYDHRPFVAHRARTPDHKTLPPAPGARSASQQAVEKLTVKLREASRADAHSVSSPVYAHLPGLRSVDSDGIDTARAKYVSLGYRDWHDLVEAAQAHGLPGDILTLAKNSPARLRQATILFEAAVALIDLSCYDAAEEVLTEVLEFDPDHCKAQLELATVLVKLGKTSAAEHRLRRMMASEPAVGDEADDQLGNVLRHLWHISWLSPGDTGTRSTVGHLRKPARRAAQLTRTSIVRRRKKACEAAQLAGSAIQCFIRAHRRNPRRYFSGFNALVLEFVLRELKIRPPQISFGLAGQSAPSYDDLKSVVRYTALSEQQRALENGDYATQFWCTTTLAGVSLIDGQPAQALALIREACAIPATTVYQLRVLHDRLELLSELRVHASKIDAAIRMIDTAVRQKIGKATYRSVVLWHGERLGGPPGTGRSVTAQARDLEGLIDKELRHWHVGKGDLAICSGMTEGDILFAERCLERGAAVRLMLREPIDGEAATTLWPPLAGPEWHERLHHLKEGRRRGPGRKTTVPENRRPQIWVDRLHLGLVTADNEHARDANEGRHRQWLFNTARMEASTSYSNRHGSPERTKLRGLFFRADGTHRVRRDGWEALVHDIEQFDDYQGEVKVLSLNGRSGKPRRS